MEDSKSIVQVVRQHFDVHVEEIVDSRLKSGIHSLFVDLTARPNASKEEVRRSIVHALGMLVKLVPALDLSGKEGTEYDERVEAWLERDEGTMIVQPQYLSDEQGSIVEFFINSATKKFGIQVNDTLDQTKRLSSEEKENNMFKNATVIALTSFSPNSTETLMLSGVLVRTSPEWSPVRRFLILSLAFQMTLELAEKSEGLFKDVLEKYSALFKNLKRVYENESMKVLEAQNDVSSPWFAVDEAIAKYDEELEKEAEWKMRIG